MVYLHPLFLWQTTSELGCLSGGKRGDFQNCSVLYCVLKLCTVMRTLRWAVLTVPWIGFCLTGPISLCLYLSVFVFLWLSCHTAYMLYYCNTVGWTFAKIIVHVSCDPLFGTHFLYITNYVRNMLQVLHELLCVADWTTTALIRQRLHYIQLDSAYFPCDESVYAD